MLTLAAVLLAADFALNKLYQKLYSVAPEKTLFFNCLLGLVTALLFFGFNRFRLHITPYSLVMASTLGVLVMAYNMIGFRLLEYGKLSVYTVFLMAGGMLLPYGFGLVFLNERFELVKMFGVALILVGVIVSGCGGKRGGKTNPKQIAFCVAVFVLNGLVGIVSKLHQIETGYESVNSLEFITLSGIFKYIFSGIL